MASLHLPVPGFLNFDAENVATVFRDWKQQWIHYSRAVDLTSKSEIVQVSTLLTCMGNEARRIFDTFVWEKDAGMYLLARNVKEHEGTHLNLRDLFDTCR